MTAPDQDYSDQDSLVHRLLDGAIRRLLVGPNVLQRVARALPRVDIGAAFRAGDGISSLPRAGAEFFSSGRRRWIPVVARACGLCLLLPGLVLAPSSATAEPANEAEAEAAVPLSPPLEDSEWRDEVLYFAIVDRFADGDESNNRRVNRNAQGAFHGGDLAGLTQQIAEIAELGATALWITPVVKNIDGFVTGAGFPDWGYHGYWADDFYALDPRFGSEDDLRRLVAAAHERGIKVLLDVVYNHGGYDSRYAQERRYRPWTRVESRGECGSDDLTGCLAGLPDFRTDLPDVRDYLLEAHLGLAERTGLDGFRLDTVKHVEHDFWQVHRQATRERLGENFFLLGEVWGGNAKALDPWFSGDEMDAGFDFGFVGSSIAFVQGRGRAVAFNRYLEKRHEVREGYHLSHYLSSHDVPGALYQLEGDLQRFRLLVALQLTTYGIPNIYYGEEVGRFGGDWPDNRSDMPWGDREIEPGAGDERNEELRDYYIQLIAARAEHPALWRGAHRGVLTDDKNLLVFAREDGESGEVVYVAVNRGEEAVSASVPVPEIWLEAGAVTELLGGSEHALAAPVEAEATANLSLTVPALSARIYAVPAGSPTAVSTELSNELPTDSSAGAPTAGSSNSAQE
ncbi:MAG: alpha-amylase family glycosyl hydrolase [Acidobacteriota bacterium]